MARLTSADLAVLGPPASPPLGIDDARLPPARVPVATLGNGCANGYWRSAGDRGVGGRHLPGAPGPGTWAGVRGQVGGRWVKGGGKRGCAHIRGGRTQSRLHPLKSLCFAYSSIVAGGLDHVPPEDVLRLFTVPLPRPGLLHEAFSDQGSWRWPFEGGRGSPESLSSPSDTKRTYRPSAGH